MDSLYNATLNATQSIFGAESVAITSHITPEVITSIELNDSSNLKLITVLLFIMYSYFIYDFRGYIQICIVSIYRPKILSKLIAERGYIFDSFVKFITITAILTFALITLKIVAIAVPYTTLSILLNNNTNLVALSILAISLAIYIYRVTIVYIVGKLTNSDHLMKQLTRYININLVIAALILTPIYLLLYQSFGLWQTIILYSIAITLGMMIFLLFFNSYKLFISQKVSILYWFLYLCAVEFLPLSIIIILVCKNLQLY